MAELERLADLDRWTLARQFRAAFGTSPGRFRTMRQLDRVRRLLSRRGVARRGRARRRLCRPEPHVAAFQARLWPDAGAMGLGGRLNVRRFSGTFSSMPHPMVRRCRDARRREPRRLPYETRFPRTRPCCLPAFARRPWPTIFPPKWQSRHPPARSRPSAAWSSCPISCREWASSSSIPRASPLDLSWPTIMTVRSSAQSTCCRSKDLNPDKSFENLAAPGGNVDHVDVYYNAGHPGVEEAAYPCRALARLGR